MLVTVEMIPQLRELSAFIEDPSSVPSTGGG